MGKHDGKEITHENLKGICRLHPTMEDVRVFFGVSADTINRRCYEYEGISFKEFRKKYMAETKLSMIQKALKMAEKNPMMMKYVLANVANWSEKKDVSANVQTSLIEWLHEDDSEEIDVTPVGGLIEE